MRDAGKWIKLLARANPPPILHRYRRPTDWTLAEISKQQIYAAPPVDLNDPFECSAPVIWDIDLLKQLYIQSASRRLSLVEAAKEFDSYFKNGLPESLREIPALIKKQCGIICLSAVPNSIRMWSYYAQAHEGICIGFDTKVHPFMLALKVKYQNPDTPLNVVVAVKRNSFELGDHIIFEKLLNGNLNKNIEFPL